MSFGNLLSFSRACFGRAQSTRGHQHSCSVNKPANKEINPIFLSALEASPSLLAPCTWLGSLQLLPPCQGVIPLSCALLWLTVYCNYANKMQLYPLA